MRKKPDDLSLTDEEIDILSGSRTPEMVKNFISRQQRNVGVRTSAYRKVAAAARAEREALTEIAMLQITRTRVGATGDVVAPVIASPEVALVAEAEALRREIARLTAQSATAHG